MSPRERRIKSDFEKIINEFHNHPNIKLEFEGNENNIPERYFIIYNNIRGVKLSKDSTSENKLIEYIFEHKVEIYLHNDYPRMKPQCYLLTDIFHPNFRMSYPHDICIGDFWASGETLVDIIYQIGEMLQYKNYNITNPLNGVAAKWARENTILFPTDNINLYRSDIDMRFKADEEINIELK